MKFKNRFVYIGLTILMLPLIFTACENSTENKNPSPTGTTLFPNMVGDKWTYTIYDSLANSVDTLNMKIIGTTTGGGKSLTIWVMESRVYNDTFYVHVDHDTVKYYDDPIPNAVEHKLVFPLQIGNFWKNQYQLSDSTVVKSIESVNVPANTYNDAYRIERNWTSFNIHGFSITWFVNNIGTVKMYRRIQGFDNIKETWELIRYTVY